MLVPVGASSPPAIQAARPPIQKPEPAKPAVQPQGPEGADLENDGDSDDAGAVATARGQVVNLLT